MSGGQTAVDRESAITTCWPSVRCDGDTFD